MRHANIKDLSQHALLLEKIRIIPGVTEKTPGHFYYKGRNVIHFHINETELYADIGEQRILLRKNNYDHIISLVAAYIHSI